MSDDLARARGLDDVGDGEDRRRPFGGLSFHEQARELMVAAGWLVRRTPAWVEHPLHEWQWQTIAGDWAYLNEDPYAAAVRIHWTK